MIHQLFRLEAEKIDSENLYAAFRKGIQNAKETRQAKHELRNYGDIYPELQKISDSVSAAGLGISFADISLDKRNAYIIEKKKGLRFGRKSTPWTALFLEWMCLYSFEHMKSFYLEQGKSVPPEFEEHYKLPKLGTLSETSTTTEIEPEIQRSGRGTSKSVVVFENQTTEMVSVYWLDYIGIEKYYFDLEPNVKFGQATLISHVWVVRNSNTEKKRLSYPTRNATGIIFMCNIICSTSKFIG